MADSSIFKEIKKGRSRIFRRARIKRKLSTTGLFESNFQDISSDVIRFGSIKSSVDSVRANRFVFNNLKLKMENSLGKYNPADDESSLWFGFENQQRTLVSIETGFIHQTLSTGGIWTNVEYPASTLWDVEKWNGSSLWDGSETVDFRGIIAGDIFSGSKNQITLNVKPLTQIFIDFPAEDLTGYTSTGLTSQQFIEMLRDQTDGSGSFIFRPFFGDTTGNWIIDTTSITYPNLNTGTADDVRDKNVWDVIEKLAEAENFVAYISNGGIFNFRAKTQSTATTFQFSGLNSFDSRFGHTIKKINRFGKKLTNYYSRINVKFREENTSTSFVTKKSSFKVESGDNPWNLGHRSLEITNVFIQTSSVAETVADTLFNELSALNDEIEFTASFVPHLELLDKISLTYDSSPTKTESLWDLNNWETASSQGLVWDASKVRIHFRTFNSRIRRKDRK